MSGIRPDDGGANDALVRGLLKDSLALWQVDAVVAASSDASAVAVIVARDGACVWIERLGDGGAFRWIVRHGKPGEAGELARAARPRPCVSLVGMLNAVRRALGVDTGEPLRIVETSATP